jgi:hypothetical protein
MDKVYLIVIGVLVIYIIYLHMQIVKMNVLIESTISRLTGIEKKWKMEELVSFIEEIKNQNYNGSFFHDRLYEEETLNFIFDNVSSTKTYIHYTKESKDAKSIISQGFRYVDSFYKTALPITNDKLDFIIKHNSRRFFGDWLMLISISNQVIQKYTALMKEAEIKEYALENILTETDPVKDENADMVYILPKQFIKGSVNHRTGEIIKNLEFNPEYDSPRFIKNMERFRD